MPSMVIRLLWCLALTLWICQPVSSAQPAIDWSTKIAHGIAYRQEGKIQQSIELLTSIRTQASNPETRAAAAGELGITFLRAHQYDAAEAALKEACSAFPTGSIHAHYALHLGTLALARKQNDEARRYYQEALTSAGDNVDTQLSVELNLARLAPADERLAKLSTLTIDGSGNNFATGIVSDAIPGSTGDAGSVDVAVASQLSIQSGGTISTSTFGSGNAGLVKVSTGSLIIDGGGSDFATGIVSVANPGSTGNAGSVDVVVTDHLTIKREGQISSGTYSSGKAGSLKVSAGSLMIDGSGSEFATGILSDANTDSTGDAGSVGVLVASQLSIQNGGRISSSTLASGKGGSINIQATTIDVSGHASNGRTSGIIASAENASSGQTGNVTVTASETVKIHNGGVVSISNAATVNGPETLIPISLSVSAPLIELRNGEITAASTGNVAASSISVNFTDHLSLEKGSITTSANIGHGGSIHIRGGNLLNLDRSQITTSVLGLAGNGGDIHIDSQALVMNTGFIQANTAAASAVGGDVQVNVNTLLPSGNTLFVGRQTPYRFMPEVFGFNVIQAAAPTGVSGAINVTAPVLDMSGSLNGLSAKVIDSGKLGRNPCQTTGGSSLAVAGRGGSAESARSWLGTELALDTILADGTEANTTPRKIAMKELGCRHL